MNRAASVWLPTGSVPRLNATWPAALRATGAWLTPSTTKATVRPASDRLLPGGGLTVAVANTASPSPVTVSGELMAVAVAAWATLCVSGAAVLAAMLVLPAKVAPMVCVPAPRLATVIAASPEAFRGAAGCAILSMTNTTCPAGAAPPPDRVTWAVKVIGWPKTDGPDGVRVVPEPARPTVPGATGRALDGA